IRYPLSSTCRGQLSPIPGAECKGRQWGVSPDQCTFARKDGIDSLNPDGFFMAEAWARPGAAASPYDSLPRSRKGDKSIYAASQLGRPIYLRRKCHWRVGNTVDCYL
ncbi:hypothetical protein E4U52_007056, partial [Claviceps spartinae]